MRDEVYYLSFYLEKILDKAAFNFIIREILAPQQAAFFFMTFWGDAGL